MYREKQVVIGLNSCQLQGILDSSCLLLHIKLNLHYNKQVRFSTFILHAPFPDLFLPCPGEPNFPFAMWIRMFATTSLLWELQVMLGQRGEKELYCFIVRNGRVKYFLYFTRDTLDTETLPLLP